MSIEDKMKDLDSLDRMEIEMEIQKKLDERKDTAFKRIVQDALRHDGLCVDKLIAALDARYVRKQ